MAGSKVRTDRPPLTVEHVKELFLRLGSSELEEETEGRR